MKKPKCKRCAEMDEQLKFLLTSTEPGSLPYWQCQWMKLATEHLRVLEKWLLLESRMKKRKAALKKEAK